MSKHRKLLVMALSLILCMSVSIGLAFAYFTDYENARGGAVLHLKGQTEITEDVDETGKTISIQNVDEPDMVVRVMIIADEAHLGEITLGEGWEGGKDGWYYYNRILKGNKDGKGDSTSDLKAKINVSGDEVVTDFEVVVVHEAERVVYDGDKVAIPDGWSITSISAE